MTKRPRVGIFSITSCAGCQLELLFSKEIGEIVDGVDFVHFPMAKEYNEEGPFDISFIEGAVVRKEEIDTIKKVRERSKIVVALGTCATYGGVPAMRNFGFEEEIKKAVYTDTAHLKSINVSGVANYIDLDYFIRGCPAEKCEIIRVLKEFLLHKKVPMHITDPVCVECREKRNECLLLKGLFCIGPVTYGGCRALCPSQGVVCTGCRGPLDDANLDALKDLFERRGMSKDDIRKIFIKFAGTSRKYAESGIVSVK
jgi:sulfhydrogenase subunit delta